MENKQHYTGGPITIKSSPSLKNNNQFIMIIRPKKFPFNYDATAGFSEKPWENFERLRKKVKFYDNSLDEEIVAIYQDVPVLEVLGPVEKLMKDAKKNKIDLKKQPYTVQEILDKYK